MEHARRVFLKIDSFITFCVTISKIREDFQNLRCDAAQRENETKKQQTKKKTFQFKHFLFMFKLYLHKLWNICSKQNGFIALSRLDAYIIQCFQGSF